MRAGRAMGSEDIIQNYPKIYDRLDTQTSLREHMIRVAAVASMICDNWTGERISKSDVVAAALIHDIGNLVKFDFEGSISRELAKEDPKGIGYWRKQQEKLIEKYKTDDAYAVTLAMAKELGVDKKIVRILEVCTAANAGKFLESKDYEVMILFYSDYRVGPFGIVSLKERLADLRKRYTGRVSRGSVLTEKYFQDVETHATEIEKLVLRSAQMSSDRINGRSVEPYILKYKQKLGKQ